MTKNTQGKTGEGRREVEYVCADPALGLTEEQVKQRLAAGWAAGKPRAAGKTEGEIAAGHIFTFFNLVFVVLALMLVLGGSTPKNMTFLIVVLCNTAIGIVQEIRAKRAVDRLNLVAERPVTVIRSGSRQEIPPEAVVRDDIALFGPGDTFCADGILRSGSLQVNESLLTGEADAIRKEPGDEVKSGSYILSGHGRLQLTAVGEESFAAKLTAAARANPKAAKSEMMGALDRLIRAVGIALVPVGLVLFYQEFRVLQQPLTESVEGTVAALVGMIPEGLYLLTSIAMAASALKLSRDRVLVQDMNCIETLARVDVLCVDKTGTITQPQMMLERLIPLGDMPEKQLEEILCALYAGEEQDNDTARAMAAEFSRDPGWQCEKKIPFASGHKWSGGIFTGRGAYLVGAPELILGPGLRDYESQLNELLERGSRVLLAAAYDGDPVPGALEPERVKPLAFCLLTSPLREQARETFSYFEAQGVNIRVLSGDNPRTASQVALRAGIRDAEKYIDASSLVTDEEIAAAAERYTVFGRVTPERKKQLLAALQAQGHTVAMTGDGVNDLLAMKQADCSVAMASGAQAACQAASLVLLNSDFAAMPGIVAEGRRVINNIQRSAALFLVKNIFSLGLALISLMTARSYPFEPIHLTLISSLTIGIPSFFLAMEPNYERIQGKFLRTVLRKACPGGLTNILMVLLAQVVLGLLPEFQTQTGTICAGVLGAVGLTVLFRVCSPFDRFRIIIWGVMAAAMALSFLLLGPVFEIYPTFRSCVLMLGFMALAPVVYGLVSRLCDLADRLVKSR